ncbi:MAG: nucleotide sugar dehydrogenase [Bacillaceae bacterium]
MKKVCVVGLGYIGLPTALLFANHGMIVHGYDINERLVKELNAGRCSIGEEGIKELLKQGFQNGTLTIGTTLQEADAFIIAVPSPILSNKEADLRAVKQATASILPHIKKGNLVVLESTVPPKTVEKVVLPILQMSGLKVGEDIFISHFPERAIPGQLIYELQHNDRIVGGINEISANMTMELYKAFVKGTFYLTDVTTAELVKVVENTYRDINIAFANELALICEKIGVNVWEVISLANHHPRVNVHHPGPGVGGHCIAVDPWFLVEMVQSEAKLIAMARRRNDEMPYYIVKKIRQVFAKQDIQLGRVALLGLAFKGNVDDCRESPAFTIIELLKQHRLSYTVYDPYVEQQMVPFQCKTVQEAVNGADIIVALTDHDQFYNLNMNSYPVRHKIVLDTRNCLNHDKWRQEGFEVHLLGDAKCKNE